ncbi:Type-1 fimbrial protein [Collimonas arenae]|uniref:Type-1 fimbrial protein n=2 Tax=Collimonas arenae TaxID=279058 RepID=A0A0A1FC60_9BURK|nr:Type-1 fimbrial protein [Collimonas arenae]
MTIAKLVAVAAAGLLSQAAFADGGTVNFNGQITASPCSIAPSSQNITVPMGTVAQSALNGAAGKKSPIPSKFQILLQCVSLPKTGAAVTFTGTADANVTDDLALANAGAVGVTTAQGVAIELGDSAGTKIPLGSASGTYVLGTGDNPLNFQAVYVSTGPTVTTGPANATAQFVVTYL